LKIKKIEFRSRPDAALRPKETSGSGVAFSLVSFFLAKHKERNSPKGEKEYTVCKLKSICTPYSLAWLISNKK